MSAMLECSISPSFPVWKIIQVFEHILIAPEVLGMDGACVTDRSRVLWEDEAGGVDIAVVIEDERLQKVDGCVDDIVVVLSEEESDDCIVEDSDSRKAEEFDWNEVAKVDGMIEGTVDGQPT